MKDLDEGFYWIVALLLFSAAVTTTACYCTHSIVERDKAAFARGYVQRIEQARRVWVKP